MKYRQLVSMPSSVSDWLEEQLEVNGIDAVVYTRYLLSILYNATLDVIGSDQDLQHSQSKKEVGETLGGDKHLHQWHSEWWRYADIDAEQLKRSSAVQSLLSASDQTDAIESLIDELCDKLNAEPAESTEPLLPSPVAYSSQELAQQYYSAFPSLPTPICTKRFGKEEGQESRSGYKMDALNNKPSVNEESMEIDQEPVHFDEIKRTSTTVNVVDELSEFMSSINPSVDYSDKKSVYDFDLELILDLIPLDATHTHDESLCRNCLRQAIQYISSNRIHGKLSSYPSHDMYKTAKPSDTEDEARNEQTKSIVKNVLSFIDISDETMGKNYAGYEDGKNYHFGNRYKSDALKDEHKMNNRNIFSAYSLSSGYDLHSIWAGRYEEPKNRSHWNIEHKDALETEKGDFSSMFRPNLSYNPDSAWANKNEIRKDDSEHGKRKSDAHVSEKPNPLSKCKPLSDTEVHWLLASLRGERRNNASILELINRHAEHNDAPKSGKNEVFSMFNRVVGSDPDSIWADENKMHKKDDFDNGKHENDAHTIERDHPFPEYNHLSDSELHSMLAALMGEYRNNALSCECMNTDGKHDDAHKNKKPGLLSMFNPVVGSDPCSSKTHRNNDSEHGEHRNDTHVSEKHPSKHNPLVDRELDLILAALREERRNNALSRALKRRERLRLLQAAGFHPCINKHYDDLKWDDYFRPSSASSLENKEIDYKPMSSRLGDLCSNDSQHHVFHSWWEGFLERLKEKSTVRAYDVISLSHSLFKLNHDNDGPFIIVRLSNSPRTEQQDGSAPAKTATSTKSALDRSDYKFLESMDTNFIPIEVQEKRNSENEIDLSESDEESSGDEQTDCGYPRGSSLSIKVPPELLKSFISKSKFYSSNKCCQTEVGEHEQMLLMVCTTDDADDYTEEFAETTDQEQRKESLEYRNHADWSMWGIGRSNLFSDKEAGEDAQENNEEDMEWDDNTLRNLWNVGNFMASSQACELCPDRVRRNLFREVEIEPQDHDSDWQELSCALDRERTKFQLESPIEGVRMYQLFGPNSKRNMKILKDSTCLPASSSFFEENCITQMPTLHTVTL